MVVFNQNLDRNNKIQRDLKIAQLKASKRLNEENLERMNSMKMMSVEASTYEGLMERLRAEYERMLERWISGGLFWHFQVYMKKYAKSGWMKRAPRYYKEPTCAILALARLGLPITGPALHYLTKIDRDVCWSRLVYLASYGILEPVEPVERRGSVAGVRGYKVSPGFLSHVYKALKELEAQEG